MEATQKMYTDTFNRKIFKTHKKYLQAKSIVANLTQCEADIQAACSWTVDEYEPTIEVGKM